MHFQSPMADSDGKYVDDINILISSPTPLAVPGSIHENNSRPMLFKPSRDDTDLTDVRVNNKRPMPKKKFV